MPNVFIIHRTEGSPEADWYHWLRAELEKLGVKVFIPQFPTPEGQNLNNWLKVFRDYPRLFDQETIVVGHSIGNAFLLNVIERLEEPIKAAFFVAPWIGPLQLGDADYEPLMRTFTSRRFDWKKIRRNCKHFYVFASDNDPYIKVAQSQEVANKTGAELILVHGAGHFESEAGYTKFPLLFEKIKKEL